MRSEYYGDFLRPYGMHSVLMAGLALEGTRFASLSLMRPATRDQFGSAEMALVAHLQPHLIRAFELGLRFRDLDRTNACITEFLDRSRHAVFLTDGAGRVCYVNRVAQTLVAANGGLAIRSGILCATQADENARLQRAIATAGVPEADHCSGAAWSLARPHGRALPLMVSPMRSERVAPYSSTPLVLVCTSDPDSVAPVPADRLRQLYGLTPAEARIAVELSLGYDPKRIAERLSLSIHTVRVHVARIFAKTETSRQADLVRLLERVCGVWTNFREPAAARNN